MLIEIKGVLDRQQLEAATYGASRLVLERGKLLVDGKRWYRERVACR